MGVTFKHEGPDLPSAVWDKKASAALARAAVDQLVQRAFHQGRDVDDNAFEPYSPRSKKKGRVDLTETGRLRSSIRVVSETPDGFVIGTDVAYAGAVDSDRPFMGLSPGDLAALESDIEQAVEDAMKRSQK